MLVPKRVKHRREFHGKMRGEAKVVKKYHSVNTVFKLQPATGSQTVKSEAARIAMTRYMKRGGKCDQDLPTQIIHR